MLQDPRFTRELLRVISAARYAAFIVNGESCGVRYDCRNLLCVPLVDRLPWLGPWRRLMGAPVTPGLAPGGGHALDLVRRWLVPVDEANISHHVPSCCVLGGACCKPPRELRNESHISPELAYSFKCCTKRGFQAAGVNRSQMVAEGGWATLQPGGMHAVT